MKHITTFNDFIKESINDKIKFKALFLCGIANAGKSTVIKHISDIPFLNINMDDYIEKFTKKSGIDMDFRPEASDLKQKEEIRFKSRDLAVDRMVNSINSMLSVVIDGTGRSLDLTIKQKEIYEEWGYDTAMVYVKIDLKTALERNSKRERKLPTNIITNMHYPVEQNSKEYSRIFDNFLEYNSLTDDINQVIKKIRNFFYSPIENTLTKEIMNNVKSVNGKYISDFYPEVKNIDFY